MTRKSFNNGSYTGMNFQFHGKPKGNILGGGFLIQTTHLPILVFTSPAFNVCGCGFLNILSLSTVTIQYEYAVV